MDVNFYQLTIKGRRSSNQDNLVGFKVADHTWFFAVADGMGGASAGEVASKLVIEKAKTMLPETFAKPVSEKDLKPVLTELYEAAQEATGNFIRNNPSKSDMGTTMVCLLIHNDKYVWGNLGDSRLYHYDGRVFEQRTTDHTVIEDMKREKKEPISDGFARQYGHIISRSIGGNDDQPDVYPSGQPYAVLPKNCLFLLCSDGLLSDKVQQPGELFTQIALGHKSLRTASEQLVSRAFYDGSKDNISVVLVEAGKNRRNKKAPPMLPFPPKESKPVKISAGEKPQPASKIRKGVLGILLALVMIVILGAAAFYLYNSSGNKSQSAKQPPAGTEVPGHHGRSPQAEIPDFSGFERSNVSFRIREDHKVISWSSHKAFVEYEVRVDGKSTVTLRKSSATTEELGIKTPGKYTLEVTAITRQGQRIPGKTGLTVTLKN
jgi:PPM family protein phosphatase